MSLPVAVFVSSGCYELRDVRVSIRDLLISFGITPQLSEDPGFYSESGVQPYVTCLDTLVECPLVVGVLEREYGNKFSDWGKYSQYNGLSPTHAEFRHALANGKKFLLYVHRDTLKDYDTWRKNPDDFAKARNKNSAEIETLELLCEMKSLKVAPWIIPFSNASDIVASLKEKLVGEIFASLKEQERRTLDGAGYIVEQFLAQTPEARHQIQSRISTDLVTEIEHLKIARAELEEAAQSSSKGLEETQTRLEQVNSRLASLEADFRNQETLLTLAAARDVRWLEAVRTQLMPKQPGRVPFHNAQEVAIRGYSVGPRQVPTLESVTWSPLPYNENGLHRGYKAGLVFRGHTFSPGIVIGIRYEHDDQLHIHWTTPNIYFGEYLELSTNEDALESPLGYRHAEFCVKNPPGQESQWVRFSYDFDDERLKAVMNASLIEGRRLLAIGDAAHAVEPLRKAMVFAKNLLGQKSTETIGITKEWNDAIDAASLARLRFRVGARVRIASGEYAGREGVIVKLYLRHVKGYYVKFDSGEEAQFGDDEVEEATP